MVICLPTNGRWGKCSRNMFGNSHSLHCFQYWKYIFFFSELFTNCIQDTFNMNMHREKMENTHENGGLLLCTNAHNIQPSGHPLADSQLGGDRAVNVYEYLKLHCPLKKCFLIGVYYNEWITGGKYLKKNLHFSGIHGMTFCKNQLQACFCHEVYFISPFEWFLRLTVLLLITLFTVGVCHAG